MSSSSAKQGVKRAASSAAAAGEPTAKRTTTDLQVSNYVYVVVFSPVELDCNTENMEPEAVEKWMRRLTRAYYYDHLGESTTDHYADEADDLEQIECVLATIKCVKFTSADAKQVAMESYDFIRENMLSSELHYVEGDKLTFTKGVSFAESQRADGDEDEDEDEENSDE